MKLFNLVANALGLVYATVDVSDDTNAWQNASDADIRVWKSDVLNAASTAKQIKNKSCQLPKGEDITKLGLPSSVRLLIAQSLVDNFIRASQLLIRIFVDDQRVVLLN